MIEFAVFTLFLGSLPKIGIYTIRTGYLFWNLDTKQSFNSPAAAAERNDRVLNRRKRALETELERRNKKLKRLDECGHTVDKILTATVCTNYEPSDEEEKEDWPVSDVSSVNLELSSSISYGNSNETWRMKNPLSLMQKLRLLNLIIFSKRQLNKNFHWSVFQEWWWSQILYWTTRLWYPDDYI